MTTFKLFSRPYTVAFIDDDRDFLELLAMAIPKHWNAAYYSKTHTFIEFCKHAAVMEQRDYAAFCALFSAQASPEHTMLKIIRYWHSNPQRWNLCEIGVLDYGMPKMTGLQVLESLDEWHGKRVLLTGLADERIAVLAFNQGLIHHYLPKHTERVMDHLVHAVNGFSPHLHFQHQQFIRSCLNDAQLSLLAEPSVVVSLNTFANEHWVEHVVLDSPFGVLGLSAMGQLSWLQLERSSDIDDLKAIAASEAWPEATQEALAQGLVLSNSLLRQALDSGFSNRFEIASNASNTSNNRLAPAIAPIVRIGDGDVVGALFEFNLHSNTTQPPTASYRDWRAVHANPSVRD